jgi:large subunit ribosomal protein L21
MFAIVEVGGFQYRIKQSDVVRVPLMQANVGEEVTLSNILAAGEGANIRVGAPTLNGAVKATVMAHGKAEKVIVFHKKRRKGYRKKNGHRQHFTDLQISSIAV